MLEKVLIINTGGTIGMIHSIPGDKNSPLKPAQNWGDIAKNFPVLDNFPTDYCQLPLLIDSSDMKPEIWIDIAKIIEKNYFKYRGFVILHGTDTMAFTASALSFMLKNLDKPVVLTGAQVPLMTPRSDALQNLITSIHIAGSELYGVRHIPEVTICFRDELLRGNRAKKMDATNYFGFSSPNYRALGEIGSEIKINDKRILPSPKERFYIDTVMNSNVIIFEIFPGLNPEYLYNLIKSNSDIKGVVLKTYGNGNAPTSKEFIKVLKEIIKKGIVVVNITQCMRGAVKMGVYEASSGLRDIGVINGKDMTVEATVTKLMYLLGKEFKNETLKYYMENSIAGELS